MVNKEFNKNNVGFEVREYKDYNDYVNHQKSKLAKIDWIDKYDEVYREVLKQRLGYFNGSDLFIGKKVLCLAARIGTEVKSFKDLGAFAIGIDLEPGNENKHGRYLWGGRFIAFEVI